MSTFLKEASDYLQELAASHKDILHSESNFAFCRFQDNNAFGKLSTSASKNIIVVAHYSGRASGQFEDAQVKTAISVRFSCYSKTVNSDDIVTSNEKALSILLDFWVKLRKDFEEAVDNCPWMRWIEWENISFDEVDNPWLINHYAWDLTIPYKTYLPEYDANKWQ
jgi:hypothetical protein